MKRKESKAEFVVVTVLLVLFAALLFGSTAISMTEADTRELEEYYLEKERQLTGEIRRLLQEEGFDNSGIMVTRVVEEDGSRLYTVTVHHGRIDSMDPSGREELLDRLRALNFTDDNCLFINKFLMEE